MKNEIRCLTGLRGVAALLVVPLHAIRMTPSAVFARHAYLWVDLFLVLSGFILARTHAPAFASRAMLPATANFLRRRIARIWPLFAAATCFELATTQLGMTWLPVLEHGWITLLAVNLLMVQAWIPMPSINSPGWSVSGEWAGCLAFPLLWRVIFTRSGWPATAVFLAAGATLAAMAANPFPPRLGPLDLSLPVSVYPVIRCLADFAMGMVMWRAAANPGLRRLAQMRGLDVGLIVVIVPLMAWRGSDTIIVLLWPLLVLCLSFEHGWLARLLGWGPIHGAGVISYSIYLVQVPLVVMQWQSALFSDIQKFLLPYGVLQSELAALAMFYLLLLPLSVMTWLLIERPGRWLLGRRRGGTVAAMG